MAVMLHSWRRYRAVCALSSSHGLLLRLTDLQTCGPFSNGAHHSQLQSASPKTIKIIKILRILLEEIKLWSIMPPLIGMYKCQISLSVMQTPFTTSMFSLDFQPLKIYRAFIKLYLPNVLLKRCQTGFLADEPEHLLLLRRLWHPNLPYPNPSAGSCLLRSSCFSRWAAKTFLITILH